MVDLWGDELENGDGKLNEKGKGLVYEGIGEGKMDGLWILRGGDLG